MTTKHELVEAGAEKLADILLHIYSENDNIQLQLDVLFATLKDNPHDIVAAIEKELSAMDDKIVGGDDDDDGNDSWRLYDFDKYIKNLRCHILNQLAPLSLVEAVKMMEKFIEAFSETAHRVSAVDWYIEYFHSICKDLKELYKKAGTSLDEITTFVTRRATEEWYIGDFIVIVLDYKEILGTEGLDLLKQKFELALSIKNGRKTVESLKCTADLQNDINAYLKVFAATLRPFNRNIDTARRLTEHAYYNEALSWLDPIDLSERKCHVNEILSLKVEIFDKLGNPDEAQMHRIQLLEDCPSKYMYDKILDNYNGQMYAQTAVQRALEFHDTHRAIFFLLAIRNMQELSKLVRTRLCDLKADKFIDLIPVADALKEYDPLSATLLCRKLIDFILVNERSYYVRGVKFLIICEKANFKITDWEQHECHSVYRKSLEERFKSRNAFWTRFEAMKENLESNL